MRPLSFVLAVALVAGCAAKPDSAALEPSVAGPVVPQGPYADAPAWTIGQGWEHRWHLGDDGNGTLLPVAVVEDRGVTWAMATPDPLTAALHAAFVIPTLGEFAKTSLDASSGEYNWPWYQFPLTDGKQWTGVAYSPRGDGTTYHYAVDFTATYDPALAYLGKSGPGFRVEGTVGGERFIATDYVPELGWFGTLDIFEVEDTPPAPAGTRLFRVVTEALGNFTGTLHTATATELLRLAQDIEPPTEVVLGPYGRFTVGERYTHILAFPYAYAAGGASHTVLVDPAGTRYEAQAVALAGTGDGALVFVPAVVGDWQVGTVGAGAFAAGGGIDAYGVVMTQLSL